MNTTSLPEQVRETAEHSGLHDPRVIAQKLIATMTTDQMEQALQAALPGYVRQVISGDQRRATRQVMRPVRSAKVAGIRDWWAEMLASSVYVDGVWKAFGTCTTFDVGWLAEQRRVEAAKNLAQAAVFDDVGSLMVAHGAEVLADLPRGVVPAALEVSL